MALGVAPTGVGDASGLPVGGGAGAGWDAGVGCATIVGATVGATVGACDGAGAVADAGATAGTAVGTRGAVVAVATVGAPTVGVPATFVGSAVAIAALTDGSGGSAGAAPAPDQIGSGGLSSVTSNVTVTKDRECLIRSSPDY